MYSSYKTNLHINHRRSSTTHLFFLPTRMHQLFTIPTTTCPLGILAMVLTWSMPPLRLCEAIGITGRVVGLTQISFGSTFNFRVSKRSFLLWTSEVSHLDRHKTRVFPSADDTRSSEWAIESDSSPRVLFNGWGVYFGAGLWGRVGEEDDLELELFFIA